MSMALKVMGVRVGAGMRPAPGEHPPTGEQACCRRGLPCTLSGHQVTSSVQAHCLIRARHVGVWAAVYMVW